MTDGRARGRLGTLADAVRRPRALLALVVAAAVAAMCVVGLFRLDVRTSLSSFLPADDEYLASYQDVGRSFGAEPLVVLVETGDATDAVLTTDRMPALVQLEGRLASLPGVASVYGPGTTLNQIAGRAKDLLAQLMGRRDAEIALAEATARERGGARAEVRRAGADARLRFDARYGPLLVSAMGGGLPTLGNQAFIDQVVYADASPGSGPRGAWRFVVPRRQAAAILIRPAADLDARGVATLLDGVDAAVDDLRPQGTSATVTGTPVIVTALSDRAVADAPVLGVLAVLGLGVCGAAAVWLRRSRRLIPLGVTLVGLAVSLSVFGWLDRPVTLGMVAFSSVLLGVGMYYPTYALTGASRRTVTVVALASGSSLASLGFSPMPLVRDIGLLLGLGVGVCLLLTLAVVRGRLATDGVVPTDPMPRAAGTGRPSTPVRVLLGAGVVAAAWGWSALPGIEVTAEVDHFAGGLPELEDARHAEQVLGSSGEVDLVLTGVDTLTPETLAWMRDAGRHVARQHGDVMQAVLSPATFLDFLGEDPTQEQVDAAARLLPSYLSGAVVSPDRSRALLTYGVRLDDVGELTALRTELLRGLPSPPAGSQVELVGLPLVLVQGQSLLSDDRMSVNLLGIAVAGSVLLVGLRRRADAVRAITAAVVATGWGFALLDLTGRGFDPVTIALGALTVAVGAEFAVVRAEAARRDSAVLRRAVVLMAAASAVGYLVLLASGLAAVRTFGAELAIGVGLALGASTLVVAATVRADRPTTPGNGEDDLVEPSIATDPREAVHV